MEWISVKAMLPKDMNPVFIADDVGMTVGFYNFLRKEWINYLDRDYPAKNVEFWQPIIYPEWPKEE